MMNQRKEDIIDKDLEGVCFLIPSLNPSEDFFIYVNELFRNGLTNVLVVNDGSDIDKKYIFDKILQCGATVINHDYNRGKGAALKTGFNYIKDNFPNIRGVVTLDSDGQHSIPDAIKVAKTLIDNGSSFVLGVRNFNGDDVPPRSKTGNQVTSRVFRLLYGRTVSDTQTGLRGIPISMIPFMLKIKGNRFEYETAMLLDVIDREIPIIEVNIETIYVEGNRETHFNPFVDSIKIYWVIFKYFIMFSLSGVLSYVIDIVVFSILTKLVFLNMQTEITVLYGTVIARMVSSVFNFWVNKTKVFNSDKPLGVSLGRYYLLCIFRTLLSSLIVSGLFFLTSIDLTLIKSVTELILFVSCFKLQKKWVFSTKIKKNSKCGSVIFIILNLLLIPIFLFNIWDFKSEYNKLSKLNYECSVYITQNNSSDRIDNMIQKNISEPIMTYSEKNILKFGREVEYVTERLDKDTVFLGINPNIVDYSFWIENKLGRIINKSFLDAISDNPDTNFYIEVVSPSDNDVRGYEKKILDYEAVINWLGSYENVTIVNME